MERRVGRYWSLELGFVSRELESWLSRDEILEDSWRDGGFCSSWVLEPPETEEEGAPTLDRDRLGNLLGEKPDKLLVLLDKLDISPAPGDSPLEEILEGIL